MRVARHVVGLTALLTALVLPAAAPAQSGDPSEGSPSGVIYEIPLDNAREDAAPTARSGGSGGGQPGTISPIRSENGFGSSSSVPGATAVSAAKTSGSGSGKAKKKSKSGAGGGSGSGGAGGGSGGTAAPKTAAEGIGGASSASITPSKSRAYLLLLLALLVAAGLGLAGRYVARRR